MALLEEALEQLVQQDELAAVEDDVLAVGVEVPVLDATEEVRVVAALAHLHDDVEDGGPAAAPAAPRVEDQVLVPGEQVLVELLLHGAHADVQDGLGLGRQRLLDWIKWGDGRAVGRCVGVCVGACVWMESCGLFQYSTHTPSHLPSPSHHTFYFLLFTVYYLHCYYYLPYLRCIA